MSVIQMLIGPLVGALIGYCTNWIAVKMLFRPLNPVKLFGKTLPFTPGVIPKNKDRLARVAGKAVGESLFTEDDLRKVFTNDTTKEKVVEKMYSMVTNDSFVEGTAKQWGYDVIGEVKTEELKERFGHFLAERIVIAFDRCDLKAMISELGGPFLREKINNPMIAMFISDSLVSSLAGPLSEGIKGYVKGQGSDMVYQMVQNEVNNLCDTEISELINPGQHADTVKAALGNVFEMAIEKLVPVILKEVNIPGIVEEKISAMDVYMLEELVLSIMKNELDYIVRLGALIGLVIGCINMLVL